VEKRFREVTGGCHLRGETLTSKKPVATNEKGRDLPLFYQKKGGDSCCSMASKRREKRMLPRRKKRTSHCLINNQQQQLIIIEKGVNNREALPKEERVGSYHFRGKA